MDFKDFINANYEIVYGDLNTADEFLLVDLPESTGHREINSLFINTFATENDIVLVEGAPSMKEIKPREAVQSTWIKTSAKLVGWNTGTIEEILKLPVCVKSEELNIDYSIILRQWREADGNKDELNLKLKETLKNNFSLIGELFSHEKEIAENVAKSFPKSIEAMKNSLIAAKKQNPERTFLIAKGLYLIPNDDEKENLRISTRGLHEFIKSRKVVILLPKEARVNEFNQQQRNFVRNLFLTT